MQLILRNRQLNKQTLNKKNMKKYMVTKLKNDSETVNFHNVEVNQVVQTNIEVQPPLPTGPPPLDELPPVTLQANIATDDSIDLKCPQNNIVLDDDVNNKTVVLDANEDLTQKKADTVTLCRDFIKGTCNRGSCKYAHRHSKSRHERYTFCHDYQTSKCVRNCKYVHATVFEEQHFYRTGYLSPLAFAHHKNNLLPPPPPPPPEEPQTNVTNPPPPRQPELHHTAPPMMTANSIPGSTMESHRKVHACAPSPVIDQRNQPPKCEWNVSQQCSSSSAEMDSNIIVTKMCKNCPQSEIRLQYYQLRVEKLRESTEDLQKKIKMLEKKSDSLDGIIYESLLYASAYSQFIFELGNKLLGKSIASMKKDSAIVEISVIFKKLINLSQNSISQNYQD